MQQTTGVPNGRTVVYGLIKIVENLVQVRTPTNLQGFLFICHDLHWLSHF